MMKAYINLEILTPEERELLEPLNFNRDGCVEIDGEIFENSNILAEDEIIEYLEKNSEHFAPEFTLISRLVPSLFYEKMCSPHRIDIEHAKEIRDKLVDFISRCERDKYDVATYDMDCIGKQPFHLFQIASWQGISTSWSEVFGSDALLAYAILRDAHKKVFPEYQKVYKRNYDRKNINKDLQSFHSSIIKELRKDKSLRRYVSSDFDVSVMDDFEATTRVDVKEDSLYFNFVSALESFVEGNKERFKSLIDLVPPYMKEKGLRFINLLKNVQRVDDLKFKEVMSLADSLAKETGIHGYYFQLSPVYKSDGSIVEWEILRGQVIKQETYEIKGKSKHQPAVVSFLDHLLTEDERRIISNGSEMRFVKPEKKEPGFVRVSYTFGQSSEFNTIVMYESANAFISSKNSECSNVYDLQKSWICNRWNNMKEEVGLEGIKNIKMEATTYHELEHHWRTEVELEKTEESAIMAGIMYSKDILTSLFLTFVSQIESEGDKVKFTNTEHGIAVDTIFRDLTGFYGITIPISDQELTWVDSLLNKISIAGEATLRKNLVEIYRLKFGIFPDYLVQTK